MYTQIEAQKVLIAEDGYNIQKGDTLYLSLDHVSSSGLTRWVKVHIVKEGKINTISHLVAIAIDNKYNTRKHTGVEVGGVGMDMGFHLVSTLAHNLFGDSYALKHSWL